MALDRVRVRFAAAFAVSFASATVFAGRYWQGHSEYFSDTANWSTETGGAGGNSGGSSLPGDGSGATYWKYFRNGKTIFDGAYSLPSRADICTFDHSYFVWDALDPSYGFTAADEFRVGSSVDHSLYSYLEIDDGTYSSTVLRVGYAQTAVAGLTINDGTLTMQKVRVTSATGSDGTLILNGGTLTVTSSDNETLSICRDENTVGTLVVNGGTLNTTNGFVSMGYANNVTATLNVRSGTWNARGFRVGGCQDSTNPRNISNAVARLVIDGGTFSWASVECGIGYCTNVGSYAEMVINGGTVNCGHNSFYVGEAGFGKFTINGGTFTMPDSEYALTLGHKKVGSDVGIVTFNGGVTTIGRIRVSYAQPGSRVVFNGGMLRATRSTTSYLVASDNVTCELQEGGLSFDTQTFNVEIKHDLVLADGVASAPLVKRGSGKLRILGGSPFTPEDLVIYDGQVELNGVTYGPNAVAAIDASGGGNLGELVIHGERLENWLNNADLSSYAGYGANGTASYDLPKPIYIEVYGTRKTYDNLEVGKLYNDAINGVSFSFTTESLPPRTMNVTAPDGNVVANVRDFGAWPLMQFYGSAQVVQGKIYRGGSLDGFANATEEQKAASALAGIKTEIDLRQAGEIAAAYQGAPKSWAATDADYYNFPMAAGCQIDTDGDFTNTIRNVFSALGAQDALPAYIHCDNGADRTGIVGLLLLGLTGTDEESLYRDYLTSNFANISSPRDLSVPERFLNLLLAGSCNDGKYVYNTKDGEYGSSIASRCRQYLEMCGVTAGEIHNITVALTGESPAEVLDRVNFYETENSYRTVYYVPYEGASETNAAHRLPAGTHTLPLTTPTLELHAFLKWNTEGETDGVVYGLWQEDFTYRYWSDDNGSAESFSRGASWDPAPSGGSLLPLDILVLNKGNDKIAQLNDGSSPTVTTLYVGWGSLDGGATTSTEYDHGGRLDVVDGLLTVTNYLYIGGYRALQSVDNIVNVTGGRIDVARLRIGTYAATGGKCDKLNISDGGTVVNTLDEARLATYESGGSVACLNIEDGGTFASSNSIKAGVYGKATLNVKNNSLLTLPASNLYLGSAATGYCELLVDGSRLIVDKFRIADVESSTGIVSVVNSSVVEAANGIRVGRNGYGELLVEDSRVTTSDFFIAGSGVSAGYTATGRATINGDSVITINGNGYLYVGQVSDGELTINGGLVDAKYVVRFGADGANGNRGVLRLNGGTLRTSQISALGTPKGLFFWNGGTLECANDAKQNVVIQASDYFKVVVLEGGAVYNAVAPDSGSETVYIEEIAQRLTGPGALVKRGEKELKVSGAADIQGGFVVEEGKLTLLDLPRARYKRLAVASGAELDLNGGVINVVTYVVDGAQMEPGTYSVHNGTVNVLAPAGGSPVIAVWTNATFDGDATNPSNWFVRNAEGEEMFDTLPNAGTDVYIPASLDRPDLARVSSKSATIVVSSSVALRGEWTIPGVVKEAKCWFDFSDTTTFAFDGQYITSVANKGTAKDILPSAEAYGNATRYPRSGATAINGLGTLLLTEVGDDDGDRSKGLRTDAIGLDGSQARTLMVVSRRGESSSHYPLGIENDAKPGYFRLERNNGCYCTASYNESQGKVVTNENTLAYNQSPKGWAIRMFQADARDGDGKSRLTTRAYSETDGATTQSAVATDLVTSPDGRLYIGHRRQSSSDSRGEIGETFYFDRALTQAEQDAMFNYLKLKWFSSGDASNIPQNMSLEENGRIDFGGGSWTFNTIKGTGTIVNATVVVTGTVEPGLVVEGGVVFAPGATIDISPLESLPTGTHVVFMTANSIAGYPARVKSNGRMSYVSLVDNGDGTVSLVGVIGVHAMSIHLR